ncbi:MAG: hydrogenase iron-sulfur subunit [Promethearchaeota archaeon]
MTIIGLALCDCFGKFADILDLDSIEQSMCDAGKFSAIIRKWDLCMPSGLETLKQFIAENNLDRIVIAACSPKVYEPAFKKLIEDLGLNKYSSLAMVNLDTHVVRVHKRIPKEATEKAKTLILAAVAKLEMAEDIEKIRINIQPNTLIIGGGIAGETAAQELTDLGFDVTLVERRPSIGGRMLQLGTVYPTDDCSLCVRSSGFVGYDIGGPRRCFYRGKLGTLDKLEILTNTEVKDVKGQVGNFKVTLEKKPRYVNDRCINCNKCAEVCPVEIPNDFDFGLSKRKAIYRPFPQSIPPYYVIDPNVCLFEKCAKCVEICPTNAINLNEKSEKMEKAFGTIIMATGFEEYDAKKLNYGHDIFPDVVTQLQLARMLDPTGPSFGEPYRPSNQEMPQKIVMIQCAGSRDEAHMPYCSNACCMIALKHSIMIKEKHPEIDITICYMDIRPVGKNYEEYYRKARELGVVFLRGKPSYVVDDQRTEKLLVEVENTLTGEFNILESDLVALSMAMVPSKGSAEVAKMLGVELDEYGFIQPLDPKVRPVETNVAGIFATGCTITPMDIPTTMTYSGTASIRAAKLMQTREMEKDKVTAWVNQEICSTCRVCEQICPFGAIEMGVKENGELGPAEVLDAKCYACGLCVSACPSAAIGFKFYSDEQLRAEIKSLLYNGSTEKKVIAFLCDECAYGTADEAGFMGLQYDPSIYIVRVPCISRVDPQLVLSTLQEGADGVLIIGCLKERCHFLKGSEIGDLRVNLLQLLLNQMGINERRVQMHFVDCAEVNVFIRAVSEMTKTLENIGKLKAS